MSFAESANLEAQGTELELSIDIDQGKAGLHVTGGQEPFEVCMSRGNGTCMSVRVFLDYPVSSLAGAHV